VRQALDCASHGGDQVPEVVELVGLKLPTLALFEVMAQHAVRALLIVPHLGAAVSAGPS
jgi:hypothetical protein